MTFQEEHGDGRPLVPREQGGIESASDGERLSEHGKTRTERPDAAEVERELEATHDDERRQRRGSTPDEDTIERALEVREDEGGR